MDHRSRLIERSELGIDEATLSEREEMVSEKRGTGTTLEEDEKGKGRNLDHLILGGKSGDPRNGTGSGADCPVNPEGE